MPRYCNIGEAFENVDIIDLSVDVELAESALEIDSAAAASASAADVAAAPFSYQVFNWTQPDVPNPGGDIGAMNGRAAEVMDAPVPVNNAAGDIVWGTKSYLRFGETMVRTAADDTIAPHWVVAVLSSVMGAHHPGGVPTIARWVESSALADIAAGREPLNISILVFSKVGGGPGVMHEVVASSTPVQWIRSYALIEQGRRFMRTLVYSSDRRLCLASLSTPEAGGRQGTFNEQVTSTFHANPSHSLTRFFPSHLCQGLGHECGNFFGGHDHYASYAVRSMEIRRFNHVSGHFERFVPTQMLAGLLPQALLDAYNFWRQIGGASQLVGVPRTKGAGEAGHLRNLEREDLAFSANTRLIVTVDDAGLATVRRVPFGEGSDAKRMVMLPLHTAAAGTPLYNLRRALVRIEDLSHVLLWSTSDPESYAAAGAGDAEQCALSLLELPRLRLRFQMRGTRFESLNYSGHFISNRPWGSGALASRIDAIPQSIVLVRLRTQTHYRRYYRYVNISCESCSQFDSRAPPPRIIFDSPCVQENDKNETFLLVPNYAVKRRAIASDPLHTQLSFVKSHPLWSKHVALRYYLFSSTLVDPLWPDQTPGLAASLYIVLMRLVSRDYLGCAQLLRACSTDLQLSIEERWALRMAITASKDDVHPDACACRLRLYLFALLCPSSDALKNDDEVEKIYKYDAYLYAQSTAICSVLCRLTPSEERMLAECLTGVDPGLGYFEFDDPQGEAVVLDDEESALVEEALRLGVATVVR